jgi:hypothetical protein
MATIVGMGGGMTDDTAVMDEVMDEAMTEAMTEAAIKVRASSIAHWRQADSLQVV